MPNSLTATGLTTATQAELIANFTAQFQQIYGANINLSSSTPDGQMLLNFVQTVLDLQDLLTTIYNMFDPNQAIGTVLDQRCAINGIQRQAGTYTITNLTVTVAQPVNLYGLDQSAQPVFTYADNAGNQWQLVTTQLGVLPGVYVYAFQAATPGAVLTVPNTITIPVTIILGITSVNNPTVYTTLGLNEETDAALKIRRQQSVSLASQGYLAGLLAALENVNGVTSAFVYENLTGVADGLSPDAAYPQGTPSHSIWVVVAGSASASLIANAIYQKRNAGCGMRGETSFTITQADGSSFIVLWDTVTTQALYISFTATSLNGVTPPNIAAIRSGLALSFTPGVYQEVNINELATIVQQIDPNTLVTSAGFSTAATGPFTTTLVPSSRKNEFTTSAANVIILPMLMQPSSATVVHATNQQFTALGGFGAYTWSMQSNPSGGSVNPSTGLYTAGSAGFTDVVRATDTQSNTVTAVITVI